MKKLLLPLLLIALISCDSTKIKRIQSSEAAATSLEKIAEARKAQADSLRKPSVSPESVQNHLDFLASDRLQGRDTGSEGLEEAALYIINYFTNYDVKPYFDSMQDHFEAEGTPTYNVVGLVEGNDPQLKKEFVIIGAHYDHIGTAKEVDGDTIANGANDNASGTAAVLEIAKYFAKEKTNRRSLIFALFSAEEKGLLGSTHLAQRLKEKEANIYTMFNLEMIGVPMVNTDYLAYLTGYENSNMADVFNAYCGKNVLGFLPQAKEYNLFMRSDNYPFYTSLGIPAQTASTFDFTNFDYYHHVSDEANKMDPEYMVNVINNLIPGIEGMTNSEARIITMNEQ